MTSPDRPALAERLGTTAQFVRSTSALIMALAVGVIAIALLLVTLQLVHGRLLGTKSGPTMNISGTGSIKQRPDRATYTMTIHGTGKTVAIALDHTNQVVRQLTRAVSDTGVPKDDITVFPSTTTQTGNGKQPWVSDVRVNIAVSQLGRADNVLRAVSRQNVTDLIGPEYSISNDNQLRERAVADAVASARRKADAAAKRGGMRVTGIAYLHEDSSAVSRPDQPTPVYEASTDSTVTTASATVGDLSVAHYAGLFEGVAEVSIKFTLATH